MPHLSHQAWKLLIVLSAAVVIMLLAEVAAAPAVGLLLAL